MVRYTTQHYKPLHHITLHHTTIHNTTLHCTTAYYIARHYVTLKTTLQHTKPLHPTLQTTSPFHTTLHHITSSLHCTTLYDRTTQTENRRAQTSMSRVRFEPTVPMFERANSFHALDRATTVNTDS
jgi:hypothetical protein